MPETITYSDIVKAWHNKKITTASEFEAVLSNIKTFFAFHSNKIEDAGVSIDHSDKIDGFVTFIKEQALKTWCRKTPRGKEFIAM